ncbi:hypothetical protein NMY22_g3349 [Coprinellus aureogranulatus]|nr:hypothetical protein NMY22_g3349 [Coprinellus aureogranulatus]
MPVRARNVGEHETTVSTRGGYSSDYAPTEISDAYPGSPTIEEDLDEIISSDSIPPIEKLLSTSNNADVFLALDEGDYEECSPGAPGHLFSDSERSEQGQDSGEDADVSDNLQQSSSDQSEGISDHGEQRSIVASSDDMGPPADRTSDMEGWFSPYDCMYDAIAMINGPQGCPEIATFCILPASPQPSIDHAAVAMVEPWNAARLSCDIRIFEAHLVNSFIQEFIACTRKVHRYPVLISWTITNIFLLAERPCRIKVANDRSHRATPSYVSSSENQRLITDTAKSQTAVNPHRMVFDKRLTGRKFDDPGVRDDMKHFPFAVFNKWGKPYIRIQYGARARNSHRQRSRLWLSQDEGDR